MYREELGYGAGALVIFSVLVAGDLWLGWNTAPFPYLFAMVALIIGGSGVKHWLEQDRTQSAPPENTKATPNAQRAAPEMMTNDDALSPTWVVWINQAALEAVAADEQVAVEELADSVADNPVAWKFGNPLHQRVTQQIRHGNPTLFGRLIQAKALAPFVVWLVHQQQERAMELRRANVAEASSRAALEIYGPFLPTADQDEAREQEEAEEAEQEGLEMLARWSQQDLGKDQDTLDDEEDERIADLHARAAEENKSRQA